MSNAKRAIMVPVLTLAVCAIAMVGLGFALTTSVTSSNDITSFQIDLANEIPETWNGVTTTTVDSIMNLTIATNKSGNDFTYAYDGGDAYLKIFSNNPSINVKKLTVELASSPTKVSSIKVSLYKESTDDKFDTPVATADTSNGGVFRESGNQKIETDVVYLVKITDVVQTIPILPSDSEKTLSVKFTASSTA